jgi:hypothetical protein
MAAAGQPSPHVIARSEATKAISNPGWNVFAGAIILAR